MQPATPDKKKEIMDRITETEQKFKELFGGNPVQDEGTDPEFMRILQQFIFGEVCYTGSLDNRLRELVTVTVLTVNQTLPQLKAHVGACLTVGLSPLEIREAVYQCAPFIGFPKALNAIAAMNEVFTQKGISLPLEKAETVTEENRLDKGKEIQESLYGDEIARRYTWLPEDFSFTAMKLPAGIPGFRRIFPGKSPNGLLNFALETLPPGGDLRGKPGNCSQWLSLQPWAVRKPR